MLTGNTWGACCATGVCIALDSDPNNCGGCGIHCPSGSSCSNGGCSEDCRTAGCPTGTSCVNNYGTYSCFPDTCSDATARGWCAPGNAEPGQCCAGSCKSIQEDNDNCGACGQRCATGTFCLYGQCQQNIDCSTGAAGTCLHGDGGVGYCCGGSCIDYTFQTDSNNCGGCGIHCAAGDVCMQGNCLKPDGGYPNGCYYDAGACAPSLACTSSGAHCETVACGPSTLGEPCVGPGNSLCCGNTCANLYADHDNCGQCGKACGANQFCDNGACKANPACTVANAGVDCAGADGGIAHCCGTSCVDLAADQNNCGTCGVVCPAGSVCNGGYCSLPDAGYSPCADVPGACPPGTVCSNTSCVPLSCPAGGTGQTCAFGTGYGQLGYSVVTGKCCGGACSDLNQDPQNCGMCGTTCTTGPGICEGSSIFTGQSQCLPTPTSDCFNCPANTFCSHGFCQPATCMGFSGGNCVANSGAVGTCCPSGFSSMCMDITSDPNNCGGCGISCGGGTCTNGVCSTTQAPCTKGHAGQYCKLDAGTQFACCPGGGCTDTSADPKNCGRCGSLCDPGLSCVGSTCVALTCTTTTQGQYCEDDAGTLGSCCGTSCVHRGSDPNNCGGCGITCLSSETCVSGDCGVASCSAQTLGSSCHFDGGSYVTPGLCCTSGCVDTDVDVNNCGGCNRQCPSGKTCNNGQCQ
jgi:hypothetical protein